MNRLKELRKKKNLTLKQLGEKVHMKNNTLSQYENGKCNPKLETWQKLADFFGVSVPYLQGFDEKTSPSKMKLYIFSYDYAFDGSESFVVLAESEDEAWSQIEEKYSDDTDYIDLDRSAYQVNIFPINKKNVIGYFA